MLKSLCVVVLVVFCCAGLYAQDAGLTEGGITLDGKNYAEPSATTSINNTVIVKNAGQQLNLTSAYVKTFKKTGLANVCSGYMFYRIYPPGSNPPGYSVINCSLFSNISNTNGLQTQEWFNNTINVDLINGLPEGDYTLDIYYGANTAAGARGCQDSPSSFIQNIQAKITITPALDAAFNGFITNSNNQYVFLQWQMTDSSNLQYFTVEKSNNGVQWITLSTVEWNSNSNVYAYIDSFPSIGVNFYRIKATSGDKTIQSISRRAYVDIVQNIIAIYPNPVNKNLRFEMSALNKGMYKATVFTAAGSKVAEKAIEHDGKDNYITLPLPALTSRGIYWLVLMNKIEFYKQNFLVQ